MDVPMWVILFWLILGHGVEFLFSLMLTEVLLVNDIQQFPRKEKQRNRDRANGQKKRTTEQLFAKPLNSW